MMKSSKGSRHLKKKRALAIIIGIVVVMGAIRIGSGTWSASLMTKDQVARAIKDQPTFQRFPSEMEVSMDGDKLQAVIEYSFDSRLQEPMEELFRQYKPDYGAFVALDAATGQVLSMVSFSRRPQEENLALKATFPSASVFKVVTAAAAIASRKYTADTIIPFNGRNHTLYKNHVLKTQINRWTRSMTLKEAFARSVNTVFGKVGAFGVGSDDLRAYADRFGFNRPISADFDFEPGHALIPDDLWGLAESASGFTRDTTMSPLQGALIAAAIANEGVMMEPYLVQSVYKKSDGAKVYSAEPRVATLTVDPKTATEIRAMMNETVRHGTSTGSFRGFFKQRGFAHIDVGGKTGSLTGNKPRGRYDWFVGYANDGMRKIAVAALTVNERFWTVKSSYLARRAIETFYKEVAPTKTVALHPTRSGRRTQ